MGLQACRRRPREDHDLPFMTVAAETGEYVLARIEGDYSHEDFNACLEAAIALLAVHRWTGLLIDLNKLPRRTPIADLFFAVTEMERKLSPKTRIALLFPEIWRGDGVFVETAAGNRGLILRSFVDLDRAIEWLTGDSS